MDHTNQLPRDLSKLKLMVLSTRFKVHSVRPHKPSNKIKSSAINLTVTKHFSLLLREEILPGIGSERVHPQKKLNMLRNLDLFLPLVPQLTQDSRKERKPMISGMPLVARPFTVPSRKWESLLVLSQDFSIAQMLTDSCILRKFSTSSKKTYATMILWFSMSSRLFISG